MLGTALQNRQNLVVTQYFPLGWQILQVCLKEKYLINLEKKDDLMLFTFATKENIPLIRSFQPYSLSGRRVKLSYLEICQYKEFSKVFFISTIFGIMSHHNAIARKIGGELLCSIQIQ